MSFEEDSFKILENIVKGNNNVMTYDFFKMPSSSLSNDTPKKIENKEECLHKNIILENVTKICTECGVVIDKDLSYDKEWRYYGQADNKRLSDPNRVHLRKIEDKNIFWIDH
jgi:hypothetical protein